MENKNKLIQCFATALGIDQSLIHEDLAYNSIQNWNSIAHMSLVAELENQFQVMLDVDDIIGLSSLKKAREILAKYGVMFA